MHISIQRVGPSLIETVLIPQRLTSYDQVHELGEPHKNLDKITGDADLIQIPALIAA